MPMSLIIFHISAKDSVGEVLQTDAAYMPAFTRIRTFLMLTKDHHRRVILDQSKDTVPEESFSL